MVYKARCAIFGCFAWASLLGLQGCFGEASFPCSVYSWHETGQDDGSLGYPSLFARHARACAPLRIAPDREAYIAGYSEGIKAYCAPTRAFVSGYRGDSYSGACPPAVQEAFLERYHAGKRVYSINLEVADLAKEVETLRERFADESVEIERRALRFEIRKRVNRIARLQSEKGRLSNGAPPT